MQASDGQCYVVKFPRSDADTALATEVICIELARLMGLAVPKACIILVSRELARDLGVTKNGWPRYVSKNGTFSCLGLLAPPHQDYCPKADLSQGDLRFLAGELVFNILVLNFMQQAPRFCVVNGNAELIFLRNSYCMMDANWPRFVKASYREWVSVPESATHRITSADQLNSWVRCARTVDVNRLWELAFSLPADWYGQHRIFLTNVLRKIDSRIGSLGQSIDYFVHQGYFPNISDGEDESTLGALALF